MQELNDLENRFQVLNYLWNASYSNETKILKEEIDFL